MVLIILRIHQVTNDIRSIHSMCKLYKTPNRNQCQRCCVLDTPYYGMDELSTQKTCLLLGHVIGCLHKCMLYDTDGFVNNDVFTLLMQPLVDQVSRTVETTLISLVNSVIGATVTVRKYSRTCLERPLVWATTRLGRPQSPARIVSNSKVPGVSDHLPDATSDRVIWFNQRCFYLLWTTGPCRQWKFQTIMSYVKLNI